MHDHFQIMVPRGLRPESSRAEGAGLNQLSGCYRLLGQLAFHVLTDLAIVLEELSLEIDAALVGQNHD